MKIVDGLIGGLAGALGVTIAHELVKKWVPDAPRLDLLGEQGAAKLVEGATGERPKQKDMYVPAMAADLVANALYYGFAAANTKHPVRTAGVLGITAGLGAIKLPSKLGLKDEYTSGTLQKKLITVGLYTLGGIVAGLAVNFFREKKA